MPFKAIGSLPGQSNILEFTRQQEDTVLRGGVEVPVVEIETVRAMREGSRLRLVTERTREGAVVARRELMGEWIPPAPAAPDLARVKFAKPIQLFNGRDLAGWRLVNPNQAGGWRVEDGVLANRPEQVLGTTAKRCGNLRTEQEFEDFRLTCEVRVPQYGNSGIYLRGVYEVQVADSFGRPRSPHNMGALYGRITPSSSAERPFGEWQTLAITLVTRHLTVVLNGVTVIDNQTVLGITGGALWANELRPGPVCLQGDHTGIEFRNIFLEPLAEGPP
jgi:hypothetical protein